LQTQSLAAFDATLVVFCPLAQAVQAVAPKLGLNAPKAQGVHAAEPGSGL